LGEDQHAERLITQEIPFFSYILIVSSRSLIQRLQADDSAEFPRIHIKAGNKNRYHLFVFDGVF